MSPDNQDRKRTRCAKCSLVQFVSAKKQCVRCHQPYVEAKPVPVVVVPQPEPVAKRVPKTLPIGTVSYWIPLVLFYERHRQSLTMQAAADKADWKRTYISKLENGHCLPQPANFQRYCAVLSTNPAKVLRMAEFLVDGE